jgi:hypothetical protein
MKYRKFIGSVHSTCVRQVLGGHAAATSGSNSSGMNTQVVPPALVQPLDRRGDELGRKPG